jgi:hypothetical protein
MIASKNNKHPQLGVGAGRAKGEMGKGKGMDSTSRSLLDDNKLF